MIVYIYVVNMNKTITTIVDIIDEKNNFINNYTWLMQSWVFK